MRNFNLQIPLRKGQNGYFASNQSVESMVKENLKNVLLTRKGEHKIFKDVGTNIYNYLFEQQTIEIKINIKREVIEAARKYVPLCDIKDVTVLFKDDILPISKYSALNIDEHAILIVITYDVVSTNGNLRIPNQSLTFIVKNQ